MPIVFNNSNTANVQTPSVDKTTLFIANTQLATKDANGNVTYYNAGGNGSPGGVTTSVQFNNSGAFAGNSAFTYDEANSLLSAGNVSVSGVSNLGSVSNVKISGGTANYVLSTDGASNLSWVAQTGGGGGGNTDWANIGNISNAYGPTSVIIGQNAGLTSAANNSIAIGKQAGEYSQSESIAIGVAAGRVQGAASIAIGTNAGQINPGTPGFGTIAMGFSAGQRGQGDGAVAIGLNAGMDAFGFSPQSAYSVAIGTEAGVGGAGINSVSIGYRASYTPANTIFLNATGYNQNPTNTDSFYVAPIRNDTSNTANSLYYNTTTKEVTYGPGGGGGGGNTDWANIGNITNANGPIGIFIGQGAAPNSAGNNAIAIGDHAGGGYGGTQENSTVAIGAGAAFYGQQVSAIAIGAAAAGGVPLIPQGAGAIAIGQSAGYNGQGANAIAIGYGTGDYQGANAIAIGSLIYTSEANTIALNATGVGFSGISGQTDSFYVAPIRNDTSNTANSLYYNTATKEVTYGPGGGGPGRIAAIYVYTRSSGTVQVPVTGGYLNVVGRSAIIPIPVN